MTQKPQADFAVHALAAALPTEGAEAPEWITIFPNSGRVDTRDGRSFNVDPARLISRFQADAVDVPVDVNHATHFAAKNGQRADPVGWIKELRVEGAQLQGRVEWLDEGKALLAAKKYRFVSPDFFHTAEGVPTWVRSVALVTAPALGNQKALAAADHSQEPPMKELASALGVTADASESALLAALGAGFVPKATHDEALAQLSAATTKLSTIESAARKATVDALLDGAVKEKKILPAQKDHYATLCATDAGLESVKSLLAATAPVLAGSGLDNKKQPEGEAPMTAAQLSAKANKMVADGDAPDYLAALSILSDKQTAA